MFGNIRTSSKQFGVLVWLWLINRNIICVFKAYISVWNKSTYPSWRLFRGWRPWRLGRTLSSIQVTWLKEHRRQYPVVRHECHCCQGEPELVSSNHAKCCLYPPVINSINAIKTLNVSTLIQNNRVSNFSYFGFRESFKDKIMWRYLNLNLLKL